MIRFGRWLVALGVALVLGVLGLAAAAAPAGAHAPASVGIAATVAGGRCTGQQAAAHATVVIGTQTYLCEQQRGDDCPRWHHHDGGYHHSPGPCRPCASPSGSPSSSVSPSSSGSPSSSPSGSPSVSTSPSSSGSPGPSASGVPSSSPSGGPSASEGPVASPSGSPSTAVVTGVGGGSSGAGSLAVTPGPLARLLIGLGVLGLVLVLAGSAAIVASRRAVV